MKLKHFSLFGMVLLSVNTQAQSHTTVCDPDVTINRAIFGGNASCTAIAVGGFPPTSYDQMPKAMRDLFKRTETVTQFYSDIEKTVYSMNPLFYDSPAPVNLSKQVTKSTAGGTFGVTYSCTANIPFKNIKTTVTKGACRNVPIPTAYTVANISNYQVTTAGCTTQNIGGTGGQGWSTTAWRLTCPSDTVQYSISSQSSSGSTTSCSVYVSTLGYQGQGNCSSYNIYKNQ